MLKSIWKDPVWSKVIASAILTVAVAIGTYVLNWWSAIANLVASAINFITSNTGVANWLIALLSLLALPTVLLLVVAIWQQFFPPKPDAPDWKNYVSDEFFGLMWCWRYHFNDISSMHTLCPHCHFQVYPTHASSFDAVDRISFYCESCHRQLGMFEEGYDLLENKAKRFVQQKLRTGKWCN